MANTYKARNTGHRGPEPGFESRRKIHPSSEMVREPEELNTGAECSARCCRAAASLVPSLSCGGKGGGEHEEQRSQGSECGSAGTRGTAGQ